MMFCSLQQAEGISGLRVLVKEGEEMFTYVWEVIHDTSDHWEVAQVFVHGTEVTKKCTENQPTNH